jgi:4-hydroxybenzoate polyprenyltransferase
MRWFPRCVVHLLRRRLLEVAVLQGSPAVAMVLAADRPGAIDLPRAALLLAGSTLLVAHVFAFNDWSDAALDAAAPRKAPGSFLARGVTRGQMLAFSAALGLAALAALALLPLPVPLLGAGVLGAGLLYSAPRFGLKRAPVLSSLVHVAGQGLHFLMGYSLVAPADGRALRLALFFALVFAAGHLNQELRDHDGDRESGVLTNAVAFGRRAAFLASGALFALAFASLAWLAERGDLPAPAAWLAALFAVYAAVFVRTLRAGFASDAVTRLQRIYRSLFCAVGVALVVLQAATVWTRTPDAPAADDPFGMAARCSWYEAERLNVQWTFYMVTDDGRLVYVGFAPRLHDPDGRPFAGVNLVVLDGNREALSLWNRFPVGAARIGATDLDAAIGANRLSRRDIGGRARYTVHLELEDGGRAIRLDAEMERVVEPCRPGGFALLSWAETGNHFEYEVPCLRGALAGTLDDGGKRTRLDGLGYLESIRWLRSRMDKPARWLWGYLHDDEISALFFAPEGYPHARSLLLVADGAECVAAVEGGPLSVTGPSPETGEVRAAFESVDLAMELSVDSRARGGGGFPIFVAPYRLDLRRGGAVYTDRGAMVFEIGQWSAF